MQQEQQGQETQQQQRGNLILPGPTLEIMKTYLPYVVIVALAFVIQNMYRDSRQDYKERISEYQNILKEQKELGAQWHDAFFQTAGLLQNAGTEDDDSSRQNSGSGDSRPPARRRSARN